MFNLNLLTYLPLKTLSVFFVAFLAIAIPLVGCSTEMTETGEEQANLENQGENQGETESDQNNDAKVETQFDIVQILKELYAPLDYFYKNIDHDTYNSIGDSALPKKYNTKEALITYFQTTMSYEMAKAYVDWYAYYDEDYKAYFVPAMGRPPTIHDYIPATIILEQTESRIVVELFFDDDWETYNVVNHIAVLPNNTYRLIMEYE